LGSIGGKPGGGQPPFQSSPKFEGNTGVIIRPSVSEGKREGIRKSTSLNRQRKRYGTANKKKTEREDWGKELKKEKTDRDQT